MATSTVYLANLSKNINNEALNIPADASLVNYFVEPLPELVLSQNQASSGTPEPQAGAQIFGPTKYLVQKDVFNTPETFNSFNQDQYLISSTFTFFATSLDYHDFGTIPEATTPPHVAQHLKFGKPIINSSTIGSKNFNFSTLTAELDVKSSNLPSSVYSFHFSRFITASKFERELKKSLRLADESAISFNKKLKNFVTQTDELFSYHPYYLDSNSSNYLQLAKEIEALKVKSQFSDMGVEMDVLLGVS
ncbi:uncharacterized protein SAPINGB_P005317 [Magnusiomyces paraingens]|uniref:Uncharacterized protein n=1 Tax=Magnusiomyces paraingens TaxID=2606893 RepID=A0A5E8C1I8_9ASCO|nr:uncharacterized protein SAPINGB_P005317 [Saprochaete ingens]VVT56830.1 unnamed protein product [Saprochaete ingens]